MGLAAVRRSTAMLKADQHLLQENEAQIQENPALNRGETVFMARRSCWANGHGLSVCLRPVISCVSRFFAMLALAVAFERAAFIRNLFVWQCASAAVLRARAESAFACLNEWLKHGLDRDPDPISAVCVDFQNRS